MYVCFVHLTYVYAGAKTPCWGHFYPTTMACPPPHHGKGHLPKGIAACRVCTMPRKGWSATLQMVLIVFKQNSVDRKLDHPKEEKPTKIYTPQQLFSNAEKIIIFVQAFNICPAVPRLGFIWRMMFWHCENLFRLPRDHHVPFFYASAHARNYGPNDVL